MRTAAAVMPLLEVAMIVVPLVLTVVKIRRFRTAFGMDVNTKKLTMHFSICLLLLALFVLDLCQNIQLIDIFVAED